MATGVCSPENVKDRGVEGKLEAAGWGLFFVWVGAAVIANVGWSIGLTGVGVIILLGQAARKWFAVKTQGFSILLGCVLILGEIWSVLAVYVTAIPFLCVALGLVLIVSAIARRSHR